MYRPKQPPPFFGGGFLSFASVEKPGLDERDVLMHHSK